jgi:hypothetical protein
MRRKFNDSPSAARLERGRGAVGMRDEKGENLEGERGKGREQRRREGENGK